MTQYVGDIYIFFYEVKEDTPEFEIQSELNKSVYDTAYEAFGPQVDDLMYKKAHLIVSYTHKTL